MENGSLIPWLTGTALIHASLAWRHRGVLEERPPSCWPWPHSALQLRHLPDPQRHLQQPARVQPLADRLDVSGTPARSGRGERTPLGMAPGQAAARQSARRGLDAGSVGGDLDGSPASVGAESPWPAPWPSRSRTSSSAARSLSVRPSTTTFSSPSAWCSWRQPGWRPGALGRGRHGSREKTATGVSGPWRGRGGDCFRLGGPAPDRRGRGRAGRPGSGSCRRGAASRC